MNIFSPDKSNEDALKNPSNSKLPIRVSFPCKINVEPLVNLIFPVILSFISFNPIPNEGNINILGPNSIFISLLINKCCLC
jgi:hypothetical protein